jgi:hypothetical protein
MKTTIYYEVYNQICDSLKGTTKIFNTEAEAREYFDSCNESHYVEMIRITEIKKLFGKTKTYWTTLEIKR